MVRASNTQLFGTGSSMRENAEATEAVYEASSDKPKGCREVLVALQNRDRVIGKARDGRGHEAIG